MKTLTEINKEIVETSDKMRGMTSEAALKDNEGRLSEDQKTEYDTLDATLTELMKEKDEIAEAVQRAKKLADTAKRSSELDTVIGDQPERLTKAEPVTTAAVIRDTQELTSYQVGAEIVKRPKFLCLGDQLQAIAGTAISNRENSMLVWDQLAVQTGGAAANVPSDGGYLVQKDFATELFSRVSAAGSLSDPLLPQVRNIPIGPNSDGLKLNVIDETSRVTGSRWGGVQVYWSAEADAATAQKPKFRQMELELKELIGLAYATSRLLQDASALEAVFLEAFSDEMSFMMEDARINGTGAGQPRGILLTTGNSATVEVAKETGQAAVTVTHTNILDMWARLWSRSRRNSVWLINQDVEPSLNKMTLPVGTGGVPTYLPPGGASAAPFGTLMGRPVVAVEYCATLGTVGDIILWDPTQYIEITKGGMQADQSIHVRFTTNENTFRFLTRKDGQPLWNSALTPFKGSNTQSPQITLATRA